MNLNARARAAMEPSALLRYSAVMSTPEDSGRIRHHRLLMLPALIAVWVPDHDSYSMSLNSLSRLGDLGADAIEIRLDGLIGCEQRSQYIHELVARTTLPLIATCRRASDGGLWQLSESSRLDALSKALDAGVEWIDLELDINFNHDHVSFMQQVSLIRSHHFERRTSRPDIRSYCEHLRNRRDLRSSDIVKLVFHGEHAEDVALAQELLNQKWPWSLAVLLSGPLSAPYRTLAQHWGSALSYAKANDKDQRESRTPCSILSEGLTKLRVPTLDNVNFLRPSQTSVANYGVVAADASSSLSPWLHGCLNALESRPLNYLPLSIAESASVLPVLDVFEIVGASVTLPHKQTLRKQALEPSPQVQSIGSLNTLVRRGEGWAAYNTDGEGFWRDLQLQFGEEAIRTIRTALVVGYGGSAAAVVKRLRSEQIHCSVAGRDKKRARAFCTTHDLEYAGEPPPSVDLIVNCTPIGMRGAGAESDLAITYVQLTTLSRTTLIYDLVYNPSPTPLVAEARKLGLRAAGGSGMLLEQALKQRELWGLQSKLSKIQRDAMCHTLRAIANEKSRWRQALRLALIGYRGVGKSTTAKLLAEVLCLPNIELDALCEQEVGGTATECFARHGESRWREAEQICLRRALERQETFVLDTGGGAIEAQAVRRLLHRNTSLVWLDAEPGDLEKRLSSQLRPALGPLSNSHLVRLPERNQYYQSLSDVRINTSKNSPEAVVAMILDWWIGKDARRAYMP